MEMKKGEVHKTRQTERKQVKLDVQPSSKMPTRDIDEGWAWVVLGVAVFNLSIFGAWTISIGIFQTEFLKHFEGSTAYVSVAGSLCVSFQMLLGPVSSVLCSCLGIRLTLMIGVACLSIGMVSASFASTLPQLIVSFGVIAGFGFGTSYTPSAIVVGHYFKEKRVLTNGIALSAAGMGMMSGPHLIGWMIDQYGWRFALSVYACVVAQMFISSSLVFPLRGVMNQAEDVHNNNQEPAESSEKLNLESDASYHVDKVTKEYKDDIINEKYMQIIEKPLTKNDETYQIPQNFVKYDHNRSMTDNISIKHPHQRKHLNFENSSCANAPKIKDVSMDQDLKFQDSSEGLHVEQTESQNQIPVGEQKTEDQSPTRKDGCCHAVSRFGQFVKDKSSALSIYKTTLFWVLGLHFYFELLGYSVQIVHLPSYALKVGVEPLQIPSLFTAYGVTMTISRLISGVAFNIAGKHILIAYIIMLFLMGLCVSIMPLFAHGFIELMIYQAMFAVTYGTSFTLVTPILIDLFGVGNLASVFGGMMFLGGLSYLTGPPFAGVLFDLTSSYSMAFHVGGLMSLLGGVIMVPVVFIKRRRDRKRIEDQESIS